MRTIILARGNRPADDRPGDTFELRLLAVSTDRQSELGKNKTSLQFESAKKNKLASSSLAKHARSSLTVPLNN